MVEKKDIPLMIKLQQQIQGLEKEKARLYMELDRRDFGSDVLNGPGDHSEIQLYEALKVSHFLQNRFAT